jgi:hypothetical protein
VHLDYGPYIWLSVPKLPLQCAAVSLYSAVKQRLKCNTGKVWDCLIQFSLNVVRGHHFFFYLCKIVYTGYLQR